MHQTESRKKTCRLGQLRAGGLIAALRVSRAGYPSRFKYAEFSARFYAAAALEAAQTAGCGADEAGAAAGEGEAGGVGGVAEDRRRCEQVLGWSGLRRQDFALGHSQVLVLCLCLLVRVFSTDARTAGRNRDMAQM